MVLLDVEEVLNSSRDNRSLFARRTIQLKDGSIRNAITGNAIKHVYVSYLHELITPKEKCDKCKLLSPMKNGKIKNPDKRFSASGNRVKECPICDISGFMNAEKDNKSEKRKTVASFSWAIAKTDTRQEDVLPIRSSEYAMVIELDLHRIGFDDEKQVYVLDKEEIKKRIRVALKGVENLLIRFGGAQTNTNHPHIRGISGIVTEKTHRRQRITKFSPLNDNFVEENQKCSDVSYTINGVTDLQQLINRLTDDEYLDAMVERNMEFVKNHFA